MTHLKKRNKKVITGTVIGCSALVAALFGAVTVMHSDTVEEEQVAVVVDATDSAAAQSVTKDQKVKPESEDIVEEVEAEIPEVEGPEVETETVDEEVETEAVEEAEPEEAESEEVTEEVDPAWANLLVANVDVSMNVRAEANVESQVVGVMSRGDAAAILEREDEWTKIQSGQVEGYILNEYCLFGNDAKDFAYSNCEMQATVLEDCVRLREEPSTESDIVELLAVDQKLSVDTYTETSEDWVAVVYDDETSYLATDYVSVEPILNLADSLEEIEARLAEEAAAAEAQRQAEEAAYLAYLESLNTPAPATTSTDTTSYSAPATTSAPVATQTTTEVAPQSTGYSASTDDVTLLAALIFCEAGGECYDGQVAVGAVVMNRVSSGSFPNTINGVIYQSGQFTPAGNGAVTRAINNGNYANCLSAAQAALAGSDPTNGLLFFHAGRSGGSLTIGNQTFY